MPSSLRLCCAAALALACCGPAATAGDSFADRVPANVRLFVELRDSADLLVPLTDAHIWATLAELAGQPASADDATEWRRRVNHTLLMEPEQAIQLLFSRGAAFVVGTPENRTEAALLCRLDGKTPLLELATRWQARPLPWSDKASVYQLRNGIGLGAVGEQLIFGDATPDAHLFASLLDLAADRGAPLSEDPVYRRLLRRVPDNPDGILFARLRPAAAALDPQAGSAPPAESQPAADSPGSAAAASESALSTAPVAGASPHEPALQSAGPAGQSAQSTAARTTRKPPIAVSELPGPLRGATTVLLSMHRDGNLLHYSAVGDAEPRPAGPLPEITELIEALPERTLVAWGGLVDFNALIAAAESLPTQNVFRVAVGSQRPVLERLSAALNSSVCLAVGAVPTEDRALPPLPAAALLLGARDGPAAEAALTDFLHSLTSVYNLLSLRAKLPLLEPAVREELDGLRIETIDLTPLVGAYLGAPDGQVELAWARDGDVLLIGSSGRWLQQLVAARQGQIGDLSRVARLTRRQVSARSETVFVAQTGPIGDLCQDWLAYFEAQHPDVLQEQWWRNRQPAGVRLGVNVAEVGEEKRLEVLALDRGSAAAGLVRPGDRIVGCEGRRFTTTQPVAELRDGLARRRSPRRFELLVERAGVMSPVTLNVPFMDPIAVLRRMAAIGGISQRVVYHDDVPDSEGPRGFLTVELRTSKARLFTSFGDESEPTPASPGGE